MAPNTDRIAPATRLIHDGPVVVGVCDDASSQYLGRGYITTCRLCGHREVVTYATHAGCYAADMRMMEHIEACRTTERHPGPVALAVAFARTLDLVWHEWRHLYETRTRAGEALVPRCAITRRTFDVTLAEMCVTTFLHPELVDTPRLFGNYWTI